MTRSAYWLFSLFFPACLLILRQVLGENTPLDQRLLGVGFFLLAIDQARMAVFDLAQIQEVKQLLSSKNQAPQQLQLKRFSRLTWSTIAWELAGFYLGAINLGGGIMVVLLSQVWFNTLAQVRLCPESATPLEPRPWSEKIGVLVADGLCLIFMGLWLARIAPFTIVITLWTIAIVYAVVKLIQSLKGTVLGDRCKPVDPQSSITRY